MEQTERERRLWRRVSAWARVANERNYGQGGEVYLTHYAGDLVHDGAAIAILTQEGKDRMVGVLRPCGTHFSSDPSYLENVRPIFEGPQRWFRLVEDEDAAYPSRFEECSPEEAIAYLSGLAVKEN